MYVLLAYVAVVVSDIKPKNNKIYIYILKKKIIDPNVFNRLSFRATIALLHELSRENVTGGDNGFLTPEN